MNKPATEQVTLEAMIDYLAGQVADGNPMFPMLIEKCHNCDSRGFNVAFTGGRNVAFTGGRYDCRHCKAAGYVSIYTDGPMSALLGSVAALGGQFEIHYEGAGFDVRIYLNGGTVLGESTGGELYLTVIAALYEAMKSMGVKE